MTLYFSKNKSLITPDLDLLSEDIYISIKHHLNIRVEKNGSACWVITQLLIWTNRAMSDLKHAGRTIATSRFCSCHSFSVLPVLSPHPSSEWRSHVKCEIKMSNAYKKEIA